MKNLISILVLFCFVAIGSSYHCFSQITITFVPSYGTTLFYTDVANTLKDYTSAQLADGFIAVSDAETIEGFAFAKRSSLISVSFPFATSIESSAFSDCIGLTTLTSASFPVVTSIGDYVFSGCTGLTSVDFPVVTSIGEYSFSGCTGLTSVSFPVAPSIGKYSFSDCTGLTTLTSVSFPNATSIGSGTFFECTGLTSVSFPAVTSIGVSAFTGCNSLTLLDFPAITSIGGFSGCTGLTSVSFPVVTSIGRSAFWGCSSLTSADFPVVTSIEDYAFYDCTGLTSVSFGTELITQTTITTDYSVFQYVPTTNADLTLGVNVLPAPVGKTWGGYTWKSISIVGTTEPTTYTLTIEPTTGGTVTTDPTNTTDLPSGTSITLTAIPDADYDFVDWSDGDIQNPRTIVLNSDITLSANFTQGTTEPTTYTLTIEPSIGGTVTTDPTNTTDLPSETSITLTAIPDADYDFVDWSDGDTQNPRTIVLTNDITLSANFIIPTLPVITSQPTSQELEEDETLILSISAEGGNLSYQWLKNDIEITDATESTYTIQSVILSDAGTYTCRVSNDAGTVLSEPAIVDVTVGIYEFINNISLSPNPANSNVTISFDISEAGNVGITLIDLSGTELMQLHSSFEDAHTFSKTFSIKHLPTGIYFLQISHNGNVRTEKIVKE